MTSLRTLAFFAAFGPLLAVSSNLLGYTATSTDAGSIYLTDGSQNDVTAAIAAASAGDTVALPAGAFTWGTGKVTTYITKAITLAGAGPTKTIITIAADSPSGTNCLIAVWAAATVKDMAFLPTASLHPVFSVSANGWRISNITYNPSAAEYVSYFVFGSGYGLIDHCNITGGGGSNELIFLRGPADSWQTPSSLGTADAAYIEDCTFNGRGYVCDMNSNARGVIRYCTIAGTMKVDGHGILSNTPAHSVRHIEVYGNRWTYGVWAGNAMELRGGTGMVFDNDAASTSVGYPWFQLREYGVNTDQGYFGRFMTPYDYPIKEQIGQGYGGVEPMYIWSNTNGGVKWPLSWAPLAAGATTQYQTQTGDATATFTLQDVIKADRDYYMDGASFNGTTGIGRGTKAQMLAITPIKMGVGFWVIDEGSWNITLPKNTSGQLYVWSGSNWALKYTPYTYPYPQPIQPVAPSLPNKEPEISVSNP